MPQTTVAVTNYDGIRKHLGNITSRNRDRTGLITRIKKDVRCVLSLKSQGEIDLLNLLRVLRNLCINSSINQTSLLGTEIPKDVISLLTNDEICLSANTKTVGLQFIGNLLPGNAAACEDMWTALYPGVFEYFLLSSTFCDKHFTICSMIIYNCFVGKVSVDSLFSSSVGKELIVALCDSMIKISDPDWIILLIKGYFCEECGFLPLVASKCSIATLIEICQLYSSIMDEEDNSCNKPIVENDFLAVYLCELFIEKYCVCVQSPSKDNADLLASVVEALCRATALPGHWTRNEVVDKTVNSAVELLRDIHQKRNSEPTNDDTEFQLYCYMQILLIKRGLIRFLGNISFENAQLQNKIRVTGGLPLILEACVIDNDSPFLQQWAIFAIRNLCQNNLENQAEIAKLEKIGVVDSPVLKSMGLTAVENEDGKMIVKPLKK